MAFSDMTKILFVIPNMEAGGSQQVMITLLRHLDRARFEPHLALLEVRGPYLNSIPQGVTIHALKASAARFAVLPIARLCWRIRPRAILSMLAYMNSAVIAARPLLPKPIRLLTREGTRTTREVTPSRLRFWSYKQVYRRADVVICQSDFMKQEMQREFGLPPEKLARIYNPVDIEFISRLARERQNPFPTPGPNLVAVGRLSEEKGLDLLLRAMPFIREAIPNVQLTIVGEGALEAALRNQARQLQLESCVRFAGVQTNPYPFLSLEALALGTFVVATNCTGAMNEIGATTRRMRIAKESTPECLAAAVRESLAMNLAASKSSGPEPEFVSRFGVSAVTRQYEDLLSPAADERWPAPLVERRPEFKFEAK
jgi:glycosyltransferase involved in cell wall biosynthesis